MMIRACGLVVFVGVLCCQVALSTGQSSFDINRYHDYHEIDAYIREVARLYPRITRLLVIGRSNEGRELLGLKIGANLNDNTVPAVYVDGGNHAREWPAFHVSAYFIDKLVNGFGHDQIITDYLERAHFFIFPVLNPDGFIYSRTSTVSLIRQWRKNRALANCTGVTAFNKHNVCCEGVDLNRNFDVQFKPTNYPFNNPCSDEYQGPFPFSEPETRAFRDFLLSKDASRIKAFISFHTHGQLFILPFNFKRKTYPNDYPELLGLAERAADAIRAVHDTKYRVGTAADMLGPVTGSASDWVKLNTPIKYVYTIELPPELRTSFAFQMKAHWLLPTSKETWAGARVIIEQVLSEFGRPR
uniref:Peptidase_M14 domain-containing protein n=1 Tax=Panagrellus redivivus TaxID=6233 RepID=A0A7E4V1C3_PANRE